MLESPANGSGLSWKQASVRLELSGQSLYCHPPPWFARMLHFASTVEPAFQTAPEGSFGNFEPMSPTFAYFVVVYTPSPLVTLGPPLARPQASYTGALPGARHGLNFVQSSSERATASRLMVRWSGLLTVAFMPLPQRSLTLGFAPPLVPPSGSLQPMLVPTVNHKQVCATSQTSVSFVHWQGSWVTFPHGCQRAFGGACSFFHSGSRLSIAFRGLG
mmetsp:Transcript_84329/g.187299  ORF Transcript_84329/g.187299 Transcript_84329/m.187299 type:complete len:217 (-) Transcript_84329:124-774(-)